MIKKSSAKKAFKQSEKRRLVNQSRKSMVRTLFKNVNKAIDEDKSYDLVMKEFVLAQSNMRRAAGKQVFHANTASRKISRLALKINSKFLIKKAEA